MGIQQSQNLTVVQEFKLQIERERKFGKIKLFVPTLVLVFLSLIFFVFDRNFLSYANIIALLNQASIPLVAAIGVTFTILMGSINLSVEGAMALSGTITAFFVLNGTNSNNLSVYAIIIALISGTLIGLTIGILQITRKVPSFLLTYGISSVCSGATLLIYRAYPITIKDEGLLSIAKGNVLGIPVLILIALVVLIIAIVVLHLMPIGRHIMAVGSDETIPKNVGININKVKLFVFAFSGMCIAIAGVMGAARLGRGDLAIGTGRLFPAITAVVLGGTSLSGGRGGVLNTLVGCLIITILNSGMIFLGVPTSVVDGFQGIIIISAVYLSVSKNRKLVIK